MKPNLPQYVLTEHVQTEHSAILRLTLGIEGKALVTAYRNSGEASKLVG